MDGIFPSLILIYFKFLFRQLNWIYVITLFVDQRCTFFFNHATFKTEFPTLKFSVFFFNYGKHKFIYLQIFSDTL